MRRIGSKPEGLKRVSTFRVTMEQKEIVATALNRKRFYETSFGGTLRTATNHRERRLTRSKD